MSGNALKLCAGKFGFAFGLIWGLAVMVLGWAAMLWGYGMPIVKGIGEYYIGYGPTWLGGVYGGLWGFVDFFVFAWLVALVYNGCLRCCKKSH